MKHTIEIMDGTGHTVIEYDPAVESEVAMAKAEFEKALGRDAEHYAGLAAKAFDNTGEVAKELAEFDPAVEVTTIIAPIAGG